MTLRTDIATAVTAELNSAAGVVAFAPAVFTAVRKYSPPAELETLDTLTVSVIGKDYEEAAASRSSSLVDISVDIGIQQKVAAEQADRVDVLAELVEQVIAFFRNRPLIECPAARWTGTRNAPVYDPKHLADKRLFTSVVTVSYRCSAPFATA